jgi:hypothetical protein
MRRVLYVRISAGLFEPISIWVDMMNLTRSTRGLDDTVKGQLHVTLILLALEQMLVFIAELLFDDSLDLAL